MANLAEVLCPGLQFRTGCNYPKLPGEQVLIGNNSGPRYEVVHVAGFTVWVRPLEYGEERLVPLDRLRLVGRPTASWPVI